jgi:DNA (cytosine-5)-methyltransferase 1
VFVVGCLGGWDSAAKVLFESESLSGDIKQSRKKREDIASFVESSFGQYREDVIAGTTKASGGVLGGGSETFLTVYENHPSDSRVKDMGDVCQTVTSTWGSGGGNIPFVQNVAFGWQNSSHQGMSVDTISPTLDKSKTPAVAVPVDMYNLTMNHDTNQTLRGVGNIDHVGGVVAPTLTASNDPSRSPQSTEVTNQVASVYAASMAVRRLTPIECERLQGFPDNYTQIPWNKKVSENCPDGLRYKAMGNSMAVPVMHWIGKRIHAFNEGL